jgi:hypothetical protein
MNGTRVASEKREHALAPLAGVTTSPQTRISRNGHWEVPRGRKTFGQASGLGMPFYRFTEHDRKRIGNLGGIMLADDAEAIEFGRRLIEDLMHRNSRTYANSSLDISDGERHVGSLTFTQQPGRMPVRRRRPF